MSRGVFLSAVAVGLATLTEPRGQKTRAQVIDAGQTRNELITCLSRSACKEMVIGASCLTGIINCQIRKENPSQTLSDVAVDFYDVRPWNYRHLTLLPR